MAYTTAWEYSLNRDDRPVALIDAIAGYCAENLQAYFWFFCRLIAVASMTDIN